MGTTKNPHPKRDGGLKPTAVPPSLTTPTHRPLCRTDLIAAIDTRLQVTVETPAPSTPLTRFGAQLPDPFRTGFPPGFHPPWLAAIHRVVRTRSVHCHLAVFNCPAQYATARSPVKGDHKRRLPGGHVPPAINGRPARKRVSVPVAPARDRAIPTRFRPDLASGGNVTRAIIETAPNGEMEILDAREE
jgi:hypothetical protein